MTTLYWLFPPFVILGPILVLISKVKLKHFISAWKERIKISPSVAPSEKMASRSSLPEEDLSCPVCGEIFERPLILSCSHSFCKECLEKTWKKTTSRDCPLCRSTSSMELPNLALKNLCESFLQKTEKRAHTSLVSPLCWHQDLRSSAVFIVKDSSSSVQLQGHTIWLMCS